MWGDFLLMDFERMHGVHVLRMWVRTVGPSCHGETKYGSNTESGLARLGWADSTPLMGVQEANGKLSGDKLRHVRPGDSDAMPEHTPDDETYDYIDKSQGELGPIEADEGARYWD